MFKPEFFLSIINDLGVFSLLALIYGLVLRKVKSPLLQQLTVGLFFGIGGCIAVLNSYEILPGVRVDVRAAMLVLAAPFSGAIAALEAATIVSALRWYQGGIGAPAGVMNILATACVGILCMWPRVGTRGEMSWRHSVCIGLLCNLPLLFILVIPIPDPIDLFLKVLGPLTVGSLAAVLMLSRILNAATQEHRERYNLLEEASVDPLTGLLNRRGFERTLKPMFSRLVSQKQTACVMVIDIDHFKQVNDRFGHATGDEVLVEVCTIIRDQFRQMDVVARFGGEEVVVFIPGVDNVGAMKSADRLRQVIAKSAILSGRSEGHHTNLTVSIGLATQRADESSFSELFMLADEALYRAKEGGRDRVESSRPIAA